jgi:hypothetical protein
MNSVESPAHHFLTANESPQSGTFTGGRKREADSRDEGLKALRGGDMPRNRIAFARHDYNETGCATVQGYSSPEHGSPIFLRAPPARLVHQKPSDSGSQQR